MYAVVAQSQALNDTALFGSPGTQTFGSTGIGISRGAAVMGQDYYVVVGSVLYEFDRFGNTFTRGTIDGTERVTTANNGEKLVIVVPGGKAYQYNETPKTLVEITDVNFQTSDTVVYKDGYFIFTTSDGKQFFNSNLSTGSSDDLVFDALDFGTAEESPDSIVAVHVSHNQLFLLGEWTIEVFQNVAGAGFPFQRIEGAALEKGAHSKYSVIQWEGFFYFIGGGINERSAVWKASAGQTAKVSTDAIDNELQKFARDEISESFSFTYSIGGHAFVGFTIRSVNIPSKTFVFNVTASMLSGSLVWSELQSGTSDNSWRANSVNNVFDKLLVSDSLDGRIGYLDADTYDEYGEPISRIKTTSPLYAGGESFVVNELELVMESGVGIKEGQGSEPVINMSYSEDGAKTWSSQFQRGIGKIGEYARRQVWRKQGYTLFSRVFRFSMTDPVKPVMIKLELEVETNG
jgi:hypothetical protein